MELYFYSKFYERFKSLFRLLIVIGIMVWLLSITGCSTADLISEERLSGLKQLDPEITTDYLCHDVIANIDPLKRYQESSSMEVIATDVWHSTIIRWLTPLDKNEQRFRAHLMLYHKDIEFTFLNGNQKDKTIGFDGQSYRYDGDRKVYEKSASISLYLGPLQNYLEWPRTLLDNSTMKLLGEKKVNGNLYWVFYATEGNTTELDQYDQFLIYINKHNKTVDYIEFTMRQLMASYVGVVHYKNYERVQGVLTPFWIGIADDLVDPGFDHVFKIESIRFYQK